MKTLSLNDEQIKQVVVALTIAAQNIFKYSNEYNKDKSVIKMDKLTNNLSFK